MKRILMVGALMAAPLAAYAGGPGCGLGSQVFDGKSGVVSHVLAATTNGTSGNQTFGMTFGTLGCDADETISADAAEFLDGNMEKVARGMATGGGEALNTLADLMGIAEADKGAFFTASQSNFSVIYSSEQVSRSEVIASLRQVMLTDAALAQYII